MSSNCKIGAEDANAPMAMWGYLSLNQAASTGSTNNSLLAGLIMSTTIRHYFQRNRNQNLFYYTRLSSQIEHSLRTKVQK